LSVIHNKAVRDRIPEIIIRGGKKPIVTILDDDSFLKVLEDKLREEVNEYLTSKEINELVDLEEILLRILELKNISCEDFTNLRLAKRIERGGFNSNLFLERVE
jgi:predicted house-cleaning noncanonical NTP pyrophosphatase (MazG superfamily)